jgi:hypothetical protein
MNKYCISTCMHIYNSKLGDQKNNRNAYKPYQKRTAVPDFVALEETLLKYGFPLNQQLPIIHNS